MDTSPASNKLATTSLTLGILGWAIYLGQWCFDLTIGLLLSMVTFGASAVCSTALDVLPFVLWLVGIVTGHVALGQLKRSGAPGHGKAIWGLVLGYSGLLFTIALIVLVVVLIAVGIGGGWVQKIFPFIPATPGYTF